MGKDIIKFVNEKYKNIDAVDNLVRYVVAKAEEGSVGSVNVCSDPEECIRRMKHMKLYFGKTGHPQARHIVVSSKKFEDASLNEICVIARKIIRYFDRKYQVIYAVHRKEYDNREDNRHIHIVINSVSIYGKKFHLNKAEFHEFVTYAKEVIEKSLGCEETNEYGTMVLDNPTGDNYKIIPVDYVVLNRTVENNTYYV